MKVYVDELPKSCSYCPCKCFETDTCQLNKGIKCPSDNKIANKCPLQSLSGYTKQVRKEVCEEIKEKFRNLKFIDVKTYGDLTTGITIDEVLKQIQGE